MLFEISTTPLPLKRLFFCVIIYLHFTFQIIYTFSTINLFLYYDTTSTS